MVRQQGLENLIETDSAGTHAYHVGRAPDPRSQQTANQRGIDISDLRARVVAPEDFLIYDYILAMDTPNMSHLRYECPEEERHRLHMFLRFGARYEVEEVPDPYYGGDRGFDYVFDLVEDAAEGLLGHIREHHL